MIRIKGFSNLFSALFFLMLITLALGSIFGAFETVISAVCDQVNRFFVLDFILWASLLFYTNQPEPGAAWNKNF